MREFLCGGAGKINTNGFTVEFDFGAYSIRVDEPRVIMAVPLRDALWMPASALLSVFGLSHVPADPGASPRRSLLPLVNC